MDENGRRLPADLSELTAEQRDTALGDMAQALGAAPRDYARLAAIERLTEMRSAGTITQEFFERERRRLQEY